MGHAAGAAHDVALGKVYLVFRTQAQILAYSDVFLYTGIVAFCVVPFCFFLTSKTAVGGPGAGRTDMTIDISNGAAPRAR